jgi:hypothetical protein
LTTHNNVSELDVVAANNSDFAGISILGTGLISTADDSFRTAGSFLAKWWQDIGGVNTVAGTGDAITVTTSTIYGALKTGMRMQFVASAANTTAVTLNLDSLGAKALRKISGGTDVALVAGDIPGAKFRVDVAYDATANSAAGAWILLGSAPVAAATTSAAGIVQLATTTEAATLSNSSKAVTPSDLVFLGGGSTTATAAGTTTLTATDNYTQVFTGTTTQTVVLPVTSTLAVGRSFRIVNNSTGNVTVQSSGANTILVVGPGQAVIFTCVLITGTTAASWDAKVTGIYLSAAVSGSAVTSIDFIFPTTANLIKRITAMMNGIGTNGTSNIMIQLGSSGSVETSGYTSSFSQAGAGSTSTAGFVQTSTETSSLVRMGHAFMTLIGGTTWVQSGSLGDSSNGVNTATSDGTKTLAAAVDRLRFTMVNGTDAFRAIGSFGVLLEY